MGNSVFVKGWLLGMAGVLVSVTREIDGIWSAIPESQHVPVLGFSLLLSLSALYYFYSAYQSAD